ncbi:hypothetical protein KIPB_013324, partial [Kipferlia bialata]|eukprot:g13324.t1
MHFGDPVELESAPTDGISDMAFSPFGAGTHLLVTDWAKAISVYDVARK